MTGREAASRLAAIGAAAASALVSSCLPQPVLALPIQCAAPAAMARLLAEKYGERIVFRGDIAGGRLTEIHVSRRGTFTVTVTVPGENRTCIVVGGEKFRPAEPPQAGEES